MDALELKVRAVLRSRNLFQLVAREHNVWLDRLRTQYPPGPHGGKFYLLKEAEKRQREVEDIGPDAAFGDMVFHFTYAAERWHQMTDPDVTEDRPYLRYVCACLPTSRPGHQEKHALILPSSHVFWTVWYPPNGPGCQCEVSSISASLMARRGWKVSDNRKFQFPVPDEGFDFNIGMLT